MKFGTVVHLEIIAKIYWLLILQNDKNSISDPLLWLPSHHWIRAGYVELIAGQFQS